MDSGLSAEAAAQACSTQLLSISISTILPAPAGMSRSTTCHNTFPPRCTPDLCQVSFVAYIGSC
jgi:hypothetical protein